MILVSAAELFRFLGSEGLRRILPTHRISGLRFYLDENGNDVYGGTIYRRRGSRTGEHLLPKIPSHAGRELMYSGDYGSNLHYVDKIKRRNERLSTRLMWRELAYGPRFHPRAISQVRIPESSHFSLRSLSRLTDLMDRTSFPIRRPIKLFIIIRGVTLDPSLTTEISFFPALRILRCECTIRQIRSSGGGIKQSSTPLGNGLSQTRA